MAPFGEGGDHDFAAHGRSSLVLPMSTAFLPSRKGLDLVFFSTGHNPASAVTLLQGFAPFKPLQDRMDPEEQANGSRYLQLWLPSEMMCDPGQGVGGRDKAKAMGTHTHTHTHNTPKDYSSDFLLWQKKKQLLLLLPLELKHKAKYFSLLTSVIKIPKAAICSANWKFITYYFLLA